MKRSIFVVAAALAALALPAGAGADVNNGSDCSYTSDEQVSQGTGNVRIYLDADGSGGMTGTALLAVGACADNLGAGTPIGTLQGGAVEIGVGTPAGGPGTYAVVDGDNQNSDLAGQSDGYLGLSNYETGPKGTCTGGGSGSNSGGCVGVDGVGSAPVPLVVCGNTSGNVWATTSRDGCSIP